MLRHRGNNVVSLPERSMNRDVQSHGRILRKNNFLRALRADIARKELPRSQQIFCGQYGRLVTSSSGISNGMVRERHCLFNAGWSP